MKLTNVIYTILIVVILGIVIVTFINKWRSESSLETFNGYIVWGMESVVFVRNADALPDDAIWVEQNDTVVELHKNAVVLKSNNPATEADDDRIIKVSFLGVTQRDGKFGHLGKYDAQVTIKDVIKYSTEVDSAFINE